MRRIAWWIAGTTLSVAMIAFVALTVGQGRTPPIDGARAVAELDQLDLNGDPQWVLIRGADNRSPVVLFLHGGPGMPAMYLAHAFQRSWERDFLMVHWDRLGAGKSYAQGLSHESLTVQRTLRDTHTLAEQLRRRFAVPCVYLLGHSWGSYLGLLAVADRPDLYCAYIGTGQMAGGVEAVRQAREKALGPMALDTRDKDLAERLRGGGLMTENDLFQHGGELFGHRSYWPILLTGLGAPEYTLRDVLNVARGATRVGSIMRGDELPLDSIVRRIEVPVYFFLGRHDLNTPPTLAVAYLETLAAPKKGVVWFEESAHFPFWEEPERFREQLALVMERTGDRHCCVAPP